MRVKETYERECTIDDAEPMMACPSECNTLDSGVMDYLSALTTDWTPFMQLSDAGYTNFLWFQRLVDHGYADGLQAPVGTTRGKRLGCQFWFRLKK